MNHFLGHQPLSVYLFSLITWSIVLLAWSNAIVKKVSKLNSALNHPGTRRICAGLMLLCIVMPYGLSYFFKGLMYVPSTALVMLALLSFQPKQLPVFLTRITGLSHIALQATTKTSLYQTISLLALFLYPMALGLGMWDPYALGYHPFCHLSVALLSIGLALLAIQVQGIYLILSIWLTAALSSFALGLYESQNLWDAVIDPFAALWAIGALVYECFTIVFNNHSKKRTF